MNGDLRVSSQYFALLTLMEPTLLQNRASTPYQVPRKRERPSTFYVFQPKPLPAMAPDSLSPSYPIRKTVPSSHKHSFDCDPPGGSGDLIIRSDLKFYWNINITPQFVILYQHSPFPPPNYLFTPSCLPAT